MHFMKEVIFMNNKEINVILTKNINKNIILLFSFESGNLELNLESNNSENIKQVFVRLASELRLSPISLNYLIDYEKINPKDDELFIDAANEYIFQLKNELLLIENDFDLKTIRENE